MIEGHIVRLAMRVLDDAIHVATELVVEPLAPKNALDGLDLALAIDDEVARPVSRLGQGTVNALDDVAALPELLQRRTPPLVEPAAASSASPIWPV